MKIKNIFLFAVFCLAAFSALRADDQNSNNLTLQLSDAGVTHTIVFDQNNIMTTPAVDFELPIYDNGGSWAYTISQNNNSTILFPIAIAPNQATVSINNFTGAIEWYSSFSLVCSPCNIGDTKVSFYYFDTSHNIVETCDFKISVVAPTAAQPPKATSSSKTK